MDVTYDFQDVESFFEEAEREVIEAMESIGQEAVDYAEAHGNYENHTWTLRRSNKYKADKEGLTLYNDAKNEQTGVLYAEIVEQKGYEVLTGAALHAEKRLKEEFEQ